MGLAIRTLAPGALRVHSSSKRDVIIGGGERESIDEHRLPAQGEHRLFPTPVRLLLVVPRVRFAERSGNLRVWDDGRASPQAYHERSSVGHRVAIFGARDGPFEALRREHLLHHRADVYPRRLRGGPGNDPHDRRVIHAAIVGHVPHGPSNANRSDKHRANVALLAPPTPEDVGRVRLRRERERRGIAKAVSQHVKTGRVNHHAETVILAAKGLERKLRQTDGSSRHLVPGESGARAAEHDADAHRAAHRR